MDEDVKPFLVYEEWLHILIHLPSLAGQFSRIGQALSCFHKTDISVNEVLKRLNFGVELRPGPRPCSWRAWSGFICSRCQWHLLKHMVVLKRGCT